MVCKGVKQIMEKFLSQKELRQLLKTRTPEQILYSYMNHRFRLKPDQIQMLIDLKKNKEVS